MAGQFKITLIGHVAIDTIIDRKGDSPRVALGGPISYCSTALKSLGANFEISTKVGKDFPEDYAKFLSQNAGIDLTPFVSEKFPTTRFRIDRSVEPRRMWLAAKCENFDSTISTRLPVKSDRDNLLIANPIVGEISLELLKLLGEKFDLVVADSQGFIRQFDSSSGEVSSKSGLDLSSLENVDYLKGDPREIAAWTGIKDLETSIRKIGKSVEHVILTSGSGPVTLYEGSSTRFQVKPFPAFEKDTTGAGDIMLATFAAAISKDEKERDALRLAVAASTLAVATRGIRKAILDPEAVRNASKKIEVIEY